MKQLIVLSIFLIATTSCGKKYNCKCITHKKASGEVVKQEVFSDRMKASRSDAQLAEDCKLTGPQKTSFMADTSLMTNCSL